MTLEEPTDVNLLRPGMSGLLVGLSVPPSPLGPLAWIAFIPLFHGWHRARSSPSVLVEAFLAFVLAGSIAFGWMVWHPSVPVVLASVGALLTWALLMAIPWAVAGRFRRKNRHPNPVAHPSAASGGPTTVSKRPWLLLVAGILVVEGILTHSPWPLPWGLLAHTQANVPWIRQMAVLGGAPLLSAWVLGANVAVYGFLRGRHGGASVLALALLLLAGFAGWRTHRAPPDRTVPILLVQPNTPATTWADVSDATRVQHLRTLTNTAIDTSSVHPAFAVWPETALPSRRPSLRDSLQQWVNQTGVPLLTGAVASVEASGEGYRHANRAVLFIPNDSTQHYDKVHLVPFVEHVPLAEKWPFLREFGVDGGGVRGYRPGPGAEQLNTSTVAIGPLICFESAVSPHARRYASGENTADVVVTLAQTGWWDSAWPARQHLAISRLRALETGRALVLATVRGPSAVVQPNGSTRALRSWDEEGALLTDLPIYETQTPYAQTGDLIFPGALLVVLVGGVRFFFLQ